MKIGFGYDIHQLVSERALVIGGVEIPSPLGEKGHSDGDVLLHAVIDALFGAAGLGDIGEHFPPSDPQYKDISSRILLRKAGELIANAGYRISNIDTVVILEKPKLSPYKKKIISTIAADLGIHAETVSLKGKTKEGFDAAGSGNAVEAYAAVLLMQAD